MTYIARSTLFEKLNRPCYTSAEKATNLCKQRQHPEVEMAHWLIQLLQFTHSDLQRIIKHFSLSEKTILADIHRYLDSLPTSHSAALDFSWVLEESVERAWVLASLLFGESKIRSGHLLAAMLETKRLRIQLLALSKEFEKLEWDSIHQEWMALLQKKPEDTSTPPPTAEKNQSSQSDKDSILEQYTVNLTEQARKGEIDSIVGRDQEIRQVIDILMRRRQNNPILTGEAGVGKTAVVEGLAHKIAAGDVPPKLATTAIHLLDMGLLQAGASMKGEFEERLRQIIEAVQGSEQPIILFIDEAHTLIGAGGQAGTSDAANLLKPALARGTLRTIAATTWSEYKKHIEKDPALTRRFQVIQVHEPDEEKAVTMLRHMIPVMEKHHKIMIRHEAITSAVALSSRYIPARQLPDKAVSLIDTACARVALTQHATPAAIDDIQKNIDAITTELTQLNKENALGFDEQSRCTQLEQEKQAAEITLKDLTAVWEQEKALVTQLDTLRKALLNDTLDKSQRDDKQAALRDCQQQLRELQKDTPLVLPEVGDQAIAAVVQDWTGIPVSRMMNDSIATTLALKDTLSERIIGQEAALEAIASRIQTSRAGLEDPNKPVGVFLLAGPSGVGKTETAIALAEQLYGGEQNLITINMSEFQESHTVSTLKGAPPGYVGYGEGGVLTEAVRRRPYSVILLDEIEKAHPDVHEIFFQVFDKGVMEDGEGRRINFKNNLILLTTNVGSERLHHLCQDPDNIPDTADLVQALRSDLLSIFPAALLGRMIVTPYTPLKPTDMAVIIQLSLDTIGRRLQDKDVDFQYEESAIALIAERCHEVESGGRMIAAILTQSILPVISRQLLESTLEGNPIEALTLSANAGEFIYQSRRVQDSELLPDTITDGETAKADINDEELEPV